jgi:hypothetical protein
MRIYNSVLNPDIWNNENEIKPDIRDRLCKIAHDFYKDTELPVPIKDIILLGSNANYNYTPTSDLDVHVIIDFSKLNMDSSMAWEFASLLKSKWNAEHDLHIKNYNVELYLQDLKAKPGAVGIFSLLNNIWLRKPVKQNIVLDRELIKKKYQDLAKRINCAIQNSELTWLKSVLKDVYDLRQVGLDQNGEFSTENIVFKLLRSKGYIEKLRQAITTVYDKSVNIN